jgi:hypothetical protein
MYTMHFQIPKATKIPDNAKRGPVLNMMSELRLAEVVPDRVTSWVAAAVDKETGAIDWTAKPLFELSWVDGRLQQVKHLSGHIAIVADTTVITQQHLFLDPCSDSHARFKLNSTEQFVKDLFAAGEGPLTFALDKKGVHLKELADKALALITSKKREVVAIEGSGDVNLDSRAKRMRRESLDKARIARAASSKVKGRVLALQGPDALAQIVQV